MFTVHDITAGPPEEVAWDGFTVVLTWISPNPSQDQVARQFRISGAENSTRERHIWSTSVRRRDSYRWDAPARLRYGGGRIGRPLGWQGQGWREFLDSTCDTQERVEAGYPSPAPSRLCEESLIVALTGVVQALTKACPECLLVVPPTRLGIPKTTPYLEEVDRRESWVPWPTAGGVIENWVFITARWSEDTGDSNSYLEHYFTIFVDFGRAASIRQADGSPLLGSFLGELFKLVPLDMSAEAADLAGRFPDLALAYP